MESPMAEKTVEVTAELPESLFNALKELAKTRGVSANTVLQQAIQTEKFFSDKERQGGQILFEGPDKTIKKIIRTD